MSFSGKKFKKTGHANIVEIVKALNLDESIVAMLREKDSTTIFTKNGDGSWTYKIETADKVLLNETFTLDKDLDYKRPDGVVNKAKFWMDGSVLKQTLTGATGKSVHFDRAFDGDTMTMTVSVDGIPGEGTVTYGLA